MEQSKDVESLLQELEMAKKEKDEAQDELQKLKSTLQMVDNAPCNEETMLWLGWVHKLSDKETILSKAQHDLKKCAAIPRALEDVIGSSLQQFKHVIVQSGHDATKVTL